MARKRKNGAAGRNEPAVKLSAVEAAAAVEAKGDVPGCDTDEPTGGKPPLFRLTVERTEGADANMAVRWCLSKEALAELLRREAKDPHLFIVMARETQSTELGARLKEVRRLLLPLDRGMDRVVFPRAGKYRVFAMVVWSAKEKPEDRWGEMHERLLNKDHFLCVRNLVNGEEFVGHKILRRDDTPHNLDHVAELRVSVDERFFAKAPPAWLASYANLWCDGKPRDECHFRNRLLWAFGIKWMPILVWCVLTGIIRTVYAMFLALIGRRDIDPRPIWHPFALTASDVNRSMDYKIRDSRGYWTKTTREGKPRALLFSLTATPVLWVVYTAAAWITWRWRGELGWNFFPIFVAAIAGACVALMFSATLLWRSLCERDEHGEAEHDQRKLAMLKAAAEAKRQHERTELALYYKLWLQPLACPEGFDERLAGTTRPKVSLAALPPTHQTVRLRFLELKARLCRPFAQ